MRRFAAPEPTLAGTWRAIILFGRNTASYKFALGKSLLELAGQGSETIALEQLAVPFARNVCEHLASADRQSISPRSRFLDAARSFNRREIDQDVLIDRTAELGFVNVIDAFHVVNGAPTPIRFFADERRTRSGGIRLTDELLALAEGTQGGNVPVEVEARWRLVEMAWELNLPRHLVTVSYEPAAELLVVESGRVRRRPITAARPALNGYQAGRCFYCGAELALTGREPCGDVDHFLAWSLTQYGFRTNLDGVWNLVLACNDCNRGPGGKGSRLPAVRFLDRLHARNEHLIASHHPLRDTLMLQTGTTEPSRALFLRRAYEEASQLLVHRWEPGTPA